MQTEATTELVSDEEMQVMQILDDAGIAEDVKERIRVLMRHLYARALITGVKTRDDGACPEIVVRDEFWDFAKTELLALYNSELLPLYNSKNDKGV